MTPVVSVPLVSRFRGALPVGIIASVLLSSIALTALGVDALNNLIIWCANFLIFTWSFEPLRALSVLSGALIIGVGLSRLFWILSKEYRGARKISQSVAIARDYSREQKLSLAHTVNYPVRVIRDERPRAVTYGLISPRIIITTALLDMLSQDELSAILSHESHHAYRRDPLRRLGWVVLEQLLFFIPIIKDLSKSCVKNQEFLADVTAIESLPSRKESLKSAISKLLLYEMQSPIITECAFAGSGAHVQWLFNGGEKRLTYRFSIVRIVVTITVSVVLLLGLTLPSQPITHAQTDRIVCDAGVVLQQSSDTSVMTPAGFIRVNYSPLTNEY